VLLQFGEILEGVELVQLAGMDQTHEQVSHAGPILSLVEVGVLAMQDHLLQGLFTNIVVERCSGVPEEEGQRLPMLTHIGDRLAQAAVGLDLALLDVLGQPALELGHLRAALGLMPVQPLFGREAPAPGLGIILVNILEDLQDIEALVGEVRRHLDKTPASVCQAEVCSEKEVVLLFAFRVPADNQQDRPFGYIVPDGARWLFTNIALMNLRRG